MNTSTLNLSITLKPSKVLAVVILALHLLAGVCIVLITIPAFFTIIMLFLLLVMVMTALRKYVWLNASNSIIKINSTATAGQYLIQTKADKTYQASMINSVWVLNYFAIIVFKVNLGSPNTKDFKVVIAKDALSQEQLYALRPTFQNLAAGQ